MVVLTLLAKHDHLQKVASTRDYVKSLGGIRLERTRRRRTSCICRICSQRLGRSRKHLDSRQRHWNIRSTRERDFGSLGESWKLQTSRTPVLSRAIHGKEGKGRLRFFSLAQKARWDSVYEQDGTAYRLTIAVDANRLPTSSVSEPVSVPPDTEIGTIVEVGST
jgi:hypothetical protein